VGNVEDVRKVIQDFVAPDLKAMTVRIEALEKEMRLRFDRVDERSSSAEKETKLRFEHVDERFSSIEKEMNLRFDYVEKLAAARHETTMATMAANQATIMNTLEMEKRLARLESERNKPEAQHA
jgi:hypothetical protein